VIHDNLAVGLKFISLTLSKYLGIFNVYLLFLNRRLQYVQMRLPSFRIVATPVDRPQSVPETKVAEVKERKKLKNPIGDFLRKVFVRLRLKFGKLSLSLSPQ
jgi:hypothetical protein